MDRRTHALLPVLAALAFNGPILSERHAKMRGKYWLKDETSKAKRARKLAKANRKRNAARRRSGNG